MNKIARTKWGVYSCPSLHITENQEWGKDKRCTFCPRLLETNYFSFFFFWFFSIFLDFFLFYFLDFPFLFFFGFFNFESKKFPYLPPHEGVFTFISRGRLNRRAFSHKCFSEFYHAKVFFEFLPHKGFKISNFTTQESWNYTTQGF